MKTHHLVSCIIIFLNTEKYIKEAIESILAQTYTDWELLLVDDGSTDRSTQIAQSYAQQYTDKIRYLEHEGHQNLGMSATRNLGIREAKGKYIAFLDADDIWLPEKLEKQLNLFQQYPEAEVVCGPTQWWYSWTGSPEDKSLDSIRDIYDRYDCLVKPPILLEKLLLDKARTPATCSVLIRRELFAKTGLFEESFRGLYEDQAFFAKVYLKANVYISSQYFDLYRQHSQNCCRVAEIGGEWTPNPANPAHLNFLKWLRQYLLDEKINDDDSKLLNILDRVFWIYSHEFIYFLLNPERCLRKIGRSILPINIRQLLWSHYTRIKGTSL